MKIKKLSNEDRDKLEMNLVKKGWEAGKIFKNILFIYFFG